MPGFPSLLSLLPRDKSGASLNDARLSYWTGQSTKTLARQRQRAGIGARSPEALLGCARSDWGTVAAPVATRPHPGAERLPPADAAIQISAAQVDLILSGFCRLPDPECLARVYLTSPGLVTACVSVGSELERDLVYLGHRLSFGIDEWHNAIRMDAAPVEPPSNYRKEGAAVRRALPELERGVRALAVQERTMLGAGLGAWRDACRGANGDWTFRKYDKLERFVAALEMLGLHASSLKAKVQGRSELLEEIRKLGLAGDLVVAGPGKRTPTAGDAVRLRVVPGSVPEIGYQSRVSRALFALAVMLRVDAALKIG